MYDIPFKDNFPPQPVNLFLTMEAGNGGDLVTIPILNAATIGSGGSWSLTPNPTVAIRVSTGFEGGILLHPITVGGITYTGSGGNRGFIYDHTIDDNYAIYDITSINSQIVSIGFWYQTNLHSSGGGSVQYDAFVIQGDGASAVVQFHDHSFSSADGLRAHGSSFIIGTQFGSTILIAPNTKYWVTMQYNGIDGIVQVIVFTVLGEQVGSISVCAIDVGISARFIYFGANNHGSNVNKFTYFDNVIMNWTQGTFPLGV